MSGDVEALAEVIRAHRCVHGFMPSNSTESVVWRKYACSCGWWSTVDQERAFTDHVATLLAAHVQAVRAEAWDEGYDARGVDISNEGLTYQSLTPNPYRAQPGADTTPDTP